MIFRVKIPGQIIEEVDVDPDSGWLGLVQTLANIFGLADPRFIKLVCRGKRVVLDEPIDLELFQANELVNVLLPKSNHGEMSDQDLETNEQSELLSLPLVGILGLSQEQVDDLDDQ